jgi:hypothetical protein
MSNAIVALVVIALMMTAVLTWSQTAYTSFDSVSQSLKQTTQITQEVSRTDITVIRALRNGSFVDVYVLNSGKVHLAQFDNWDLLIQYYDAGKTYHITPVSYTSNSNPGDNRWTVAQIYSDSSMTTKEVYEPGILNPGEVLFMKARMSPAVGTKTTNMVTVSTDNGVAASAQFTTG